MSEEDEIARLRERIDEVDEQLLRLLNERVRIAQEIGRVKSTGGGDFYRPEREAQVLRRVMRSNPGPLSDDAVGVLFREIMSAALAAESPIAAAYLGPEGTYSQAAALKHFGRSARLKARATVDQIFGSVEKGDADYGVVPVENSIEGMVSHTLDKFMDSPLKICGEVNVRIRHQLLSAASDLKDVNLVLAHGQSLAQCRGWVGANLPSAKLESVVSNAEAARRAAETPGSAAIASSHAGEVYGLKVLAGDIEDHPSNTTRFLVVGRQSPPPSGDDKTSLLVSSKNKPGALHRLLTPLARHGISMSRIESRPSRQALWEYVFFIDIEGHRDDPAVQGALAELDGEAAFLKILGAYPRSPL